MSKDPGCCWNRRAPARGRIALLGALGFAVLVAGSLAAVAGGAEIDLGEIHWSQFQGDPAHSGVAGAGAPSPPYRELWTFQEPGSDRGLSSPVIVGDVALAVGVEGVYGVDLQTGAERVRFPRAGGPLAPPAIGTAGGLTVLVFTEGEEVDASAVVAFDLAHPDEELWRVPIDEVTGSGVSIDGDLVVVGDDGGELYGIGLEKGDLRWKLEGQGRVGAPAAASDGRVVAALFDQNGAATRVVAVDAAGPDDEKPAWTFEAPLLNAGDTVSAPAFGHDGDVVIGTPDRLLSSIDAGGGTRRWTSRLGASLWPTSAPVAGDVVLASDIGGGLYAIDPSTGDRVWSYQLNEPSRGMPLVVGDSVLLGLADGRVVAIDTASAELVWRSEPSTGAIGGIAAGPGVVLVARGGEDGGLVAFASDPQGRLSAIRSPTVPDFPAMLGAFAVALVVLSAALVGIGRLAVLRFGPPEPIESAEPDEPLETDG